MWKLQIALNFMLKLKANYLEFVNIDEILQTEYIDSLNNSNSNLYTVFTITLFFMFNIDV
jgi:hypothetical protein